MGSNIGSSGETETAKFATGYGTRRFQSSAPFSLFMERKIWRRRGGVHDRGSIIRRRNPFGTLLYVDDIREPCPVVRRIRKEWSLGAAMKRFYDKR